VPIVVENLRSAVAASYQELSAQVQAASALDAKLLGLLGFFAVADSLLLGLQPGLRHGRALLLAGTGLATLVCLVATVRRKTPDVGPPAAEFYRDYGFSSEVDYLEQLLIDLTAKVRVNATEIAFRGSAVAVAVGIPAIFAALFGLLIPL
jgi:hypothetical protein